MAVQRIHLEETTTAAARDVWSLLADSASWPTWTPIDRHEAIEPGAADGVGEVRVFHNGRHTVRERIVEKRSQKRLSYTLLAGLALRDYRADVDLKETSDGGTTIIWHTEFVPKVPLTGGIYRAALIKATQQFVDGLVEASAHASIAPATNIADLDVSRRPTNETGQ